MQLHGIQTAGTHMLLRYMKFTNLIRIVLVFKKIRMQASLNALNLLILLLFLGGHKCLNNRDRDTGAADIRFIFHSRSYDPLYRQTL